MSFKDKKSDNLDILSDIYQDDRTESNKNKNLLYAIRSYFSDPKKAERWLSGAVLFLGFFGLVFGIWHFKNQIKNPFVRKPSGQASLLNANSNQDLLGLMNKDTDSDGLSDYDELNVYKTSPYLQDSDSDGITDPKEIANGTDPNCPAGQDCFAFKDIAPNSNTNTNTSSSGTADALSGNYTVAQLRQLLKDAGMSEEMLSQLSDQEIIQSYQDALNTASSGVNTNSGTAVNLPAKSISDLTPQEIRDLLKTQGVSADALSQISDEELMNLVAESLKEVKQ